MAKEDEGEPKVPEEMFKDVKFYAVGDIDPKVPRRARERERARALCAGGGGLLARGGRRWSGLWRRRVSSVPPWSPEASQAPTEAWPDGKRRLLPPILLGLPGLLLRHE